MPWLGLEDEDDDERWTLLPSGLCVVEVLATWNTWPSRNDQREAYSCGDAVAVRTRRDEPGDVLLCLGQVVRLGDFTSPSPKVWYAERFLARSDDRASW
jgi:hypothetical protein